MLNPECYLRLFVDIFRKKSDSIPDIFHIFAFDCTDLTQLEILTIPTTKYTEKKIESYSAINLMQFTAEGSQNKCCTYILEYK